MAAPRYPARVSGVAAMIVLALASPGTATPVGPSQTTYPTPGVAPSRCERIERGYRCTYGPIEIGAGKTVEFMSGMAAPSEAGYLTSARATLVDGEGEAISHDEVHLHHLVFLNPNEEDLMCDEYDGAFPPYERFFASGKERTPLQLPPGYGYHWSPVAPQPYTQSAPYWALVGHLDGVAGHADTHVQLTVGFTPDDQASGMVGITPVWFDVRNCRSAPVFTVEKGSGRNGVYRETTRQEMPLGGRFIFMAGHLHDGGLWISLDDRTSGAHIFKSRATYASSHHGWDLARMGTFASLPGVAVSEGDILRLTAAYDSSRRWKDVMGIMVGALVPKQPSG
ncbi:MAG: hypothetical protein ABR575_11790 [Actinomycetota bacterium]